MKAIGILFTWCFLVAHAIGQTGSLDPTFTPGSGANNYIFSTVVQPDDKILIAGGFTTYNGTSINRIARLNPDGTLDPSFDPGIGANDYVQCICLQPDGKILIGGFFVEYDGHPVGQIARLNPDGSLDESFTTGTGFDGSVLSIALQSDGKILSGGFHSAYNGVTCCTIARLNTDGTLDQTFNPGTGPNIGVHAIDIKSNGKIVIGGFFNQVNGISKNRIAQLHPDGSLDQLFDCGNVPNDVTRYVKVQPDGKILAGSSSMGSSGSGSYFRRFNSNGSLDASFSSPFATVGIAGIALQSDGKIIVGGPTILSRLNPNGSTDNSFSCGSGPFVGIASISFQSDDKIIIGGSFQSYNGTNINRIARIQNLCPTQSYTLVASSCESYSMNGNTYTASGQYVTSITNCSPSVTLTLDLTILNPSFSTITDSACIDYTLNGITYSQSGVYEQVLYNQAGCDSTITLHITIIPEPELVIVDLGGILHANASGLYQWINCGTDDPVPGATNQDFTPTENGTYAVVLTNGSCSTTSNCLTVDYVSVNSSELSGISLYPNPTADNVRIDLSTEGSYLVVLDSQGRTIQEMGLNTHNEVSLSNLSTGTYFFSIYFSGQSKTYRVVKQ